jgi:hypothetical protein
MKGDFIMTIAEKIQANNNRIAVLKSRGEAMNTRIINKLIRKNRALAKQK